MVQQLRRQNEFLQSTHHVMEQRVLALESRPTNMLWDEVKRLQQQNQALLKEMETLRKGKKPSKPDHGPTTPRIIGPRDVQDQDDSEDDSGVTTPNREKRLLALDGKSAGELREELQQLYGQLRDQDELLDEVEGLRLRNSEMERSQRILQQKLSGILGEPSSSAQGRDLPGWNTSSGGCQSCHVLPASCTEVSETLGKEFRSGEIYSIDPDGPGQGVPPTPVQCERVGDAVASSFGHDSESRTVVEGYEEPGSYSRNITYWTSLEQIRAVIRRSKRCMQFIKYECLSSVLHRGSTGFAWWLSADGRRKDYWGGGRPGTSNCACGEAGTCGGGRACKCDSGLDSWQEDSGWLMHKRHLPVTQLRFGDTDTDGKQGYHTLGRLICF
ncbi:neurexin-4-like [Branchiostoma floridae x Branchiostoma japonicum]